LDMYAPTGDTLTKRPAIVWVHGGGFAGGDKTSGELVDESNVFSKKGYVNVSIDYRLYAQGCSAAAGAQTGCLTAITDAQHDAQAAGVLSFLTTYQGAGHVPYDHRDEILLQTSNFLYQAMDLAHAAR